MQDQPIETYETDNNASVLSDWRVDGNGVLAEGEYENGSVLGKDANGNFELAIDATKAEAILLEATTVAVGQVRNAPILTGGIFAEQDIKLGGVLTVDDVRDVLRYKNLYIKMRG